MAGEINIFIGAESIISPLGFTAEENFERAKNGETALQIHSHPFEDFTEIFAAKMPSDFASAINKIEKFCRLAVKTSLGKLNEKSLNGKWGIVLSTTKGNIELLKDKDFDAAQTDHLINSIQEEMPQPSEGHVISVACISGLAATIYAADMLRTNRYDHVLVVGADVLSAFTVSGFQSFYALSPELCRPFDEHRNGLNLGEAAAAVVLSRDAAVFADVPMRYISGATSNDANHISGPSRTGEGLYRAIAKTLKYGKIESEQIDYVSAHGTGTRYNDDMESIAFSRHGLQKVSTNSLKGYFGHTLGASSLIEIAMGFQGMRQNIVLKTHGCLEKGTTENVNITLENKSKEVNYMLKTASGFGGCNAAAIFKKG